MLINNKNKNNDTLCRCSNFSLTLSGPQLHQCRQNHSDILGQKENLQQTLEEERKTSTQLQQRFQILSHNHDEMTTIKDGYKSSNEILHQENEKLREKSTDNASKFLQEREREIGLLKEEIGLLKEEGREREERERVMKERCEVLEREVVRLKQQIQERDELNGGKLERETILLKGTYIVQ